MRDPVQKLQSKIGVGDDGFIGPKTLKAFAAHFRLSLPAVAHFFGQTGHETGGFRVFSENLNYSKQNLLKTFSKHFTPITALQYQRDPEKIANKVYANRMGNGTESSGDGWKFRGRGALQLTGRANYQAFADYMGDQTIVTNPDVVAESYAFESAIFFFRRNGLWPIAEQGVSDAIIQKITKKVNGGTNGLADRIVLTKKYYELITK